MRRRPDPHRPLVSTPGSAYTYEGSWRTKKPPNEPMFYQGTVSRMWQGAFVDQDWVCEHRHPTRESATACGEKERFLRHGL